MQGERILSLDFLKAVAIIAVVLGHIASPLSHFIFAWHMPAFFFASGFLLWKGRSKDKVLSIFNRHDLFHLGRYYFVFGLLAIIAEYIKVQALGRTPMDVWETLIGFIYFMDMPHLHHYGFILWFLPALFCAKLFMRALMRFSRKSGCMLVGAALLFFAGWMLPTDIPLGFGIHAGLLAVLWCVLGGVFCQVVERRNDISMSRIFVFAVCLIAAAVLPIPPLDIASYFVPMPLYNILYSLMIIYILMFLGRLLESRGGSHFSIAVGFISRNSIYIMAFHVYTNNAAGVILKHYHYEMWWAEFVLSCVFLVPILLIFHIFESMWKRVTGEAVK